MCASSHRIHTRIQLDSLADVLAILANNSYDILSLAVEEAYGSSAAVSNHPAAVTSLHLENAAYKNSFSLFQICQLYLKILTSTPTSFDSNDDSAGHQTASTDELLTQPSLRNLLTDCYRTGSSVGNVVLNALSFSHVSGSNSLSKMLWNYLNHFGHDVVLEALILRDELLTQSLDKYSTDRSNSFVKSTSASSSSSSSSLSSSSSSSSPIIDAAKCSKELKNCSALLGMNNHEFCLGISLVFWLFCSVFVLQLTATDDEELFESPDSVSVDDLVSIVMILKKLLYRLHYVTSPCSPLSLNLSAITNALWDKTAATSSSSYSSSSQNNNQLQFFRISKEVVDTEDAVVSRCHQIWVYTRLFNSLFAVNLRRSFMSANEWQWSGIVALASDLEGKVQELATNGTYDDTPTDMTILLANSSMKFVLQVMPQVIPFQQRITIFQALIAADSHKYNPPHTFFSSSGSTRIQVHRNNILEDSVDQLHNLNESKLKARIQVEFISETGLQEAGIDGGGLFKAFLDLLMKHSFDPSLGLFYLTQDQLLTPSPASELTHENHLRYFNFIGTCPSFVCNYFSYFLKLYYMVCR